MDGRIARALTLMQQHLDQSVSLHEHAAEVNLSASRFSHLFREHTGLPPLRYVHVLRMTRARVLLEGTFLTVKEVMFQVGFSDPSHFSRSFRRFHGITASELRRQRITRPADEVARDPARATHRIPQQH
ncbi:MAG: helix-turn-helix domain-containing protein [Acidobacteria bacterium]|nr:helix-turn-helix domain-containing protein [Acidobacteriota bacterium]